MQPHATLRTRILWICLLVVLGHQRAGVAADPATPAPRPPNILFLLTDDQRWDTLGCMGNTVIQTPQIDRLAARGTLFSNAFVTASVCSVSRAAILTGAYPCSRGVGDLVAMVTPAAMSATSAQEATKPDTSANGTWGRAKTAFKWA